MSMLPADIHHRLESKPADYITVTKGLRGYFAVHVTYSPSPGAPGEFFPEPWESSPISHETYEEAASEAKKWAGAEEMRCEA